MNKHWNEISLEEAAAYYKNCIGNYTDDLSLKAKENIAHKIVWYTLGDNFNAWAQTYPILLEIQAYANDLSWSNSSDTDEDWERLLGYIEQLDQEVNHGRSGK